MLRNIIRSRAMVSAQIAPIQIRSFGLFDSFFGKKTVEVDSQKKDDSQQREKKEVGPVKELTARQQRRKEFSNKMKQVETEKKRKLSDSELREIVRSLPRSGVKNMYTRVPKTRMTAKERNQNLDAFIHPDLVGHDQVTIERFESKNMKRGLQEDETPFPVVEKVGPYVVSIVKSFSNCFCVSR